MILKHIDDKSKQILTLKKLYSKSTSEAQKKLIKSDLSRVSNGDKAEKDNAYYLDFAFDKSKNIILLHDVRLEHNDRTAQFDHILISRFGIELLETKSSQGSITINNDGSMTYKSKSTNTLPNPLEQSYRHAEVLKDFINNSELLSKRIAIFGGIDISSKVLIHPETTITNKKLPDGFERGDSFVTSRNKEIDDIGFFKAMGLLGKMYDINKAKEIAQIIVDAHKPVEYDYTKKYRMKKIELVDETYDAVPIKEKIEEASFKKVCPRCNEGELIVKKIKSKKAIEKYSNDEFIGCSRYPKCRYTESQS